MTRMKGPSSILFFLKMSKLLSFKIATSFMVEGIFIFFFIRWIGDSGRPLSVASGAGVH